MQPPAQQFIKKPTKYTALNKIPNNKFQSIKLGPHFNAACYYKDMTDEKNGKYWSSDSRGVVDSICDLKNVLDNNKELTFMDIGSKHLLLIYDEGPDVWSIPLKDLKTNTSLRPYWVKDADPGDKTEYTIGKLGTEIVWHKGTQKLARNASWKDYPTHEIMKAKKVSVVGGLLNEINDPGTIQTSNNDSTNLNNSKALNSSGMDNKLSESKDQSKLDMSMSMENPGAGKRRVDQNFEEEYVAYIFEHAQGEYNSLIATLKELS
jgi:hypothetical protein